MTRQRNDDHGTEFGLWLRRQSIICSSAGYVATNLDYIWSNYKTGKWMLIEEKRFNRQPTWSQTKQFKVLHEASVHDRDYTGFYVIVFENTSPIDGAVSINSVVVDSDELLNFLSFKLTVKCYFDQASHFET